jgi:hypothetical protein
MRTTGAKISCASGVQNLRSVGDALRSQRALYRPNYRVIVTGVNAPVQGHDQQSSFDLDLASVILLADPHTSLHAVAWKLANPDKQGSGCWVTLMGEWLSRLRTGPLVWNL